MEENTHKQIDQIFKEAERTLSNKVSTIKEEIRKMGEKIVKEHVDLK